jgi:hypothetical protein
MSFETRANIYLLTFLGSVIVGVTASVYFDGVQTQATRARIQWELQRERERHPETAPIKGFSNVTEAPDGELITIDVHLDGKGLCVGTERELINICTITAFSMDFRESILLRLRKCSDTVDTDCLRCTDINGDPLEYQKIVALDGSGKPIDFVGAQRLEQGWYLEPQPLRLTGRVTRIDGVGRFVEPILKIERVPASD